MKYQAGGGGGAQLEYQRHCVQCSISILVYIVLHMEYRWP